MRDDETFGEARERLARDIESLPWPMRLVMHRRLRKLDRKIDDERDRVLRRYWTDIDPPTEEDR